MCIEKYNLSTRKKVQCNSYFKDKKNNSLNKKCLYTCCKSCIKRYIISSGCTAQCMNCKSNYDEDFIIKNLNRNWLNKDYKEHLGNLLIETEKNKIPDIMIYVENYKKIPILRKRLKETMNLILNVKEQLKTLKLKIHNKSNVIYMLQSILRKNETKNENYKLELKIM